MDRGMLCCAMLGLTAMLWSAPSLADDAHDHDHDHAAAAFAEPIEKAHGLVSWQKHKAVQYDIVISFGDNTILEGATLFELGSERVRITTKAGVTMVWDGRDAWYTPADANLPGPPPRFHLRTWTYFLAAPFKLRDPGAHLEPMEMATLTPVSSTLLKRAKLTFGKDVGDAPDDWYVLYRDAKTERLKAMAYIVTYGKGRAEAEKEPHAIVYEDFERVDGVVLPMTWTFHHWSADEGIPMGEERKELGAVQISNLRFLVPAEDAFKVPEGAKRDPLPGEAAK